MGLLSVLDLPPVERDRRLAQMEQGWKNEEAHAERLQVRRGAMATLLEDVLSEQLQALMNDAPSAPDKEGLRRFKAWCRSHEMQPTPPVPAECIAFFLLEVSGSYQDAVRMADSIGRAHKLNHHEDPTSDIYVRAALLYLEEKRAKTNGAKTNGHAEHEPTTQHLKGLN